MDDYAGIGVSPTTSSVCILDAAGQMVWKATSRLPYKARRQAKAARSRETLERALSEALGAITAENARGWFRHRGYPTD